jgi:DMSO/TMAO reductase YedYZ heme-binding membrane subunit
VIYRGFNPRTRLLRWGAVAIVLGIALGVFLPLAIRAVVDLAAVAPDRLAWVGTRMFAFLSYFALAGSVIYGLLLSTKILDRLAHRPVTYALHKDLALVGLALAVVHVVLLGFDSKVPFSIADMVVPFAAPYRPVWIGTGQIALYLTGVVVGSFYVLRRIGQRTWRLLHYLTFVSFMASALHGVFSGTDTSTAWAWWAYTISVVLVVFLTTYRIIDAAATRDERRAAAEAVAMAARSGRIPPRPPAPALGPLDRRAPAPRR